MNLEALLPIAYRHQRISWPVSLCYRLQPQICYTISLRFPLSRTLVLAQFQDFHLDPKWILAQIIVHTLRAAAEWEVAIDSSRKDVRGIDYNWEFSLKNDGACICIDIRTYSLSSLSSLSTWLPLTAPEAAAESSVASSRYRSTQRLQPSGQHSCSQLLIHVR